MDVVPMLLLVEARMNVSSVPCLEGLKRPSRRWCQLLVIEVISELWDVTRDTYGGEYECVAHVPVHSCCIRGVA